MKYRLQDLIDMEHFQNLQDRLNKIYSFPSSIIDNDGNILTATAWQDICTQFHRKNKDTELHCIKSDQYIQSHIHEANPAVSYRCPHGLVDNATPIIIDGIHYGNFFTGQFFLEEPDMDFFKVQARKYGFDEEAYFEAVKKVPIWTQDQLDNYLFFIKGLIAVISESGLKKLKEMETRKQIEKSEKQHRSILKTAMDGFWLTDTEGRLLEINDAYCEMSGYSQNELLTMYISDLEASENPQLVAKHMDILISKESDRFESKHRRKDGTIFDIEVSVQFRPEEGGQCVCFLRDITERKQADKALRQSEERFRYLSDGSMEAIFFTKNGFCLEANQVAVEMFGYDNRSQFIGKFGTDIIAPESHSLVKSYMLTDSFEPYEAVGIRKNGTRFPIAIRAKAMPYKDEGIVRVTSITDITEIKKVEKALQESEKDLKESQRIAHVGSWRLDLTSNQVVWSDELYKMYGFDPALPPPPYTEHQKLFAPESWDMLSAALNNTIDTGIPYKLELKTLQEDGNHGWMWVHGETVLDARGVTVGLRGAAQDITERKKAEEALLVSETRLRTLVETIPDLIWLKDIEGVFLDCNAMFERLFGAAKKDIIGKTDYDFVDRELADFFRENDRKAIAAGKPCSNEEWLTFADNGYRGLFDTIKTPMVDVDGNLLGVLGIARDITDRLQAEEEKTKLKARLLQAQKMESIGSLAGGIAHDLNNILFPISGLSEMLLDEIQPDNHSYESLEQILKSAQRGSELVKQILAFSRQSNPQKLPIRIQPILKEVMKLSRATIPMNIEITSLINNDCGMVSADPTQVHQIVMNLITNAYHAVEETGGTINVELKEAEFEEDDALKPGKYAHITISDTGIGIEQTLIDKIFDPYFTTKEMGKGTGLGLSVVHGIVKEHGGDIQVYSEIGKGTTFNVYLPLLEDAKDSKFAVAKKKHPIGCERILLVDDEEPILRMEQMILERLGYQVTSRNSSPDALAAFKDNPGSFDLVISDRGMPNMTGDQLAGELISIRPGVPIILCTGFSSENDAKRVKAMGIKGFLMKPVATGDLAEMVRKVLDMEH